MAFAHCRLWRTTIGQAPTRRPSVYVTHRWFPSAVRGWSHWTRVPWGCAKRANTRVGPPRDQPSVCRSGESSDLPTHSGGWLLAGDRSSCTLETRIQWRSLCPVPLRAAEQALFTLPVLFPGRPQRHLYIVKPSRRPQGIPAVDALHRSRGLLPLCVGVACRRQVPPDPLRRPGRRKPRPPVAGSRHCVSKVAPRPCALCRGAIGCCW